MHHDRVVAAEHALWVARHDSHDRGVYVHGASCGQQLGEVCLREADARVLEGPGVRVAALPLLEEQLPVRVGENSRLVLLLDVFPRVATADYRRLPVGNADRGRSAWQ